MENQSQANNIDMADHSILAWLVKNKIKNEKGEALDFYDRPFLLDILTDWTPDQVVRKCAQIGGSVSFNLKVLYAIKKKKFNIIYTFPSDSDVKEFVASKTNKIISANQDEFPNMEVDSIERKELDGRFLFFKGTISKTAAIMTSADIVVHDEASRSDQKALEMYKSRTKASQYKGRWIFSNPTIDKDILDLEWMKSDKKEWHIKCSNPECPSPIQYLTFPDSIQSDTYEDENGDQITHNTRFACKHCKTTITDEQRRNGFWKATCPNNKLSPNKTISGYHISLLMAPWISAAEILEDSKGDQTYFYNFVLGEPYSPGDLNINRSTILDNWTAQDLRKEAELKGERLFLGVDIGNTKHFALGTSRGLIRVGTFSKWHELDDLIKAYDPITVIDAMPENTMSREYTAKYPNVFMCYLNRDKDTKRLIRFEQKENAGIIHADRNRLIDQIVNDILSAKLLYNLVPDNYLEDYIKHCESLKRVKVLDKLGVERFVWESTNGIDHYFFATLFYYIARQTTGGGFIAGEANRRIVGAISRTSTGDYANIKEYLENRENGDA